MSPSHGSKFFYEVHADFSDGGRGRSLPQWKFATTTTTRRDRGRSLPQWKFATTTTTRRDTFLSYT